MIYDLLVLFKPVTSKIRIFNRLTHFKTNFFCNLKPDYEKNIFIYLIKGAQALQKFDGEIYKHETSRYIIKYKCTINIVV